MNEAKLCAEKFSALAHTYAVGYRDEEFDELMKLSSHVTFNSLNQFYKFQDRVPPRISMGLRVNPEWSDVVADLYNPAHAHSRLGLISSSLPEALPPNIEGLHFHVLCESSAAALVQVLENFETKFKKYLPNIKWLNMGGGHLITKEGYDVELLVDALKYFKKKYQVEIILEPGGAIAWQAGFLKTTIIDIVENEGSPTAVIDASFTCHMPDCLEMPYRPEIMEGSHHAKKQPFRYKIGGVSCLAGDFLADYSFSKPLKIGDTLTFLNMMHYTMVKTTMFNGVNHPSIGVIRADHTFELLKTFSYQDYRDKLS
jgi:carboxynorspermidine decarboxylase